MHNTESLPKKQTFQRKSRFFSLLNPPSGAFLQNSEAATLYPIAGQRIILIVNSFKFRYSLLPDSEQLELGVMTKLPEHSGTAKDPFA